MKIIITNETEGWGYYLNNFKEIPRINDNIVIDDKEYTVKKIRWITETQGLNIIKKLKEVRIYV